MMSGEPGGFFDEHTFEAEGQQEIWKARTEFADFEFEVGFLVNIFLIANRTYTKLDENINFVLICI